MCEFCHQHGEGRKWYLNTSNYSEELFNEAARHTMVDVLRPLSATDTKWPAPPAGWDTVRSMAPGVAAWVERRFMKDIHWGQVVPIDDVLEVVDMLDWVIRLPCVCRAANTGDRNARYCFGLGLARVEEPVRKLFEDAIDPSLGVEKLTKEQAKEALVDLDWRGAMHSVWTFKSPFIGAVCNCDRDCQAYRSQMIGKSQIMFRAEYVARVDPDRCRGCRRCMRQCLFGAVQHSLAQGKCEVNAAACYGCGVCRSTCERHAISLVPRKSTAVAGVWGL